MSTVSYEGSNPAEVQVGDNPKHKQLMAWKVKDESGEHEIVYHHASTGFGSSIHNFSMHEGEHFIGTMGLSKEGTIQHIEIHPEKRRQGLATKLLKFGRELHSEIDSIPAPQHSETRTAEGDAWAQAQGAKKATIPVAKEDYRAARWLSLRDNSIPALKSHLNEFHAKMLQNNLGPSARGDVRFHVDSAHEYLTRAAEVGKEHPRYFDHMNNAHKEFDALADIHEEHGGNMDEHQALNDHITRLY